MNTLLFVVKLPEITRNVYNKFDYNDYYWKMEDFEVKESNFRYGDFSSAVIYNDYVDFAEKVVHYIQFL